MAFRYAGRLAAELYVQPNRYPGGLEQNVAGLKMLKENYGGELVMLPGESNSGHWETDQFIRSFDPALTPAEAILQAGQLCYSGSDKIIRLTSQQFDIHVSRYPDC